MNRSQVGMMDLAQALREAPRPITPRQPTVLDNLRQVLIWASITAVTVCLAVVAGRSDGGAQRLAGLFGGSPAAAHSFDAEVETQALAAAVRSLAGQTAELRNRLGALEQNLEDVTGSITKQIEAAQHNDDGPSLLATAGASYATTPVPPAGAFPMVRPPPAEAALPSPEAPSPGVTPRLLASLAPKASANPPPKLPEGALYGADIGSGQTIQALRARWATLRAAHPQLLDGMTPVVAVKELPKTNRVELRLIAGPLMEADAAVQFCASLTGAGLFCQPTAYEGQRLAQR
jgi:hypothetical protein